MYQLQCTEWTDLHNGLTSHIYHVTNYCNGIIAIVYTSVLAGVDTSVLAGVDTSVLAALFSPSAYVLTSYLQC